MHIIKLARLGTRSDDPEADESGNAWMHFRAPDGFIYEFTQDPGGSRPV
ncbi:hypothetical protein BH20ACT6_BH20ACT6_19690 [soil metagenome]